MTPELRKILKDRWSEIGTLIIGVIGFVVDHWDLAGPRVSAIWEHIWPIIAAYAAFRLFQFGRSLYQRFTSLELQVFGNAVDVDTRLDEQAKAHQDSINEVVRIFKEELQKKSQQLDTQAHNRSKDLEEVLRQEIKERKKLEAQVVELTNKIYPEKQRETHRERIAELLTTQQVTKTLADMTPGEILAFGAPSPKRKT